MPVKCKVRKTWQNEPGNLYINIVNELERSNEIQFFYKQNIIFYSVQRVLKIVSTDYPHRENKSSLLISQQCSSTIS